MSSAVKIHSDSTRSKARVRKTRIGKKGSISKENKVRVSDKTTSEQSRI